MGDNWNNTVGLFVCDFKYHHRNINCLEFLQVSREERGGEEILHFHKDDDTFPTGNLN